MLLTGKSVAPGIAVGTISIYKKDIYLPAETFIKPGEEQTQLDRYLKVKEQAKSELEVLKLSLQSKTESEPEKAAIFTAHQEIIDDIIINEEIPAKITNELWAGDWAIYNVYETVIAVLQKASDQLIAERAADFDDVRSLLLRLWYSFEIDSDKKNINKKTDNFFSALTEPVIIAAYELMPSDTALLDKSKVLAILTTAGGITSHAAIIAKSYGIPAIMGIQELLDTVKHGQLAVINAEDTQGTIILEPEKKIIDEYLEKIETLRTKKQQTDKFLESDAYTKDGVKIDIGLNIGDTETELKTTSLPDFAGLVRTEFLFMNRDTLPSEDEQFQVYREILEAFGEKPCFLRTLDIGGDKNLPELKVPNEENPSLGNRALRFCFSYPDIFKIQLRACLRASVYGNLWLMLPMAGSLDDIRRAKDIIENIKNELNNEKKEVGDFKTGIMIEVPSIALISDLTVKEVDFASIGSNDLCQYLCAADRTNSTVEPYYQSYHPAMFRLIKESITAFINAGKPISICGELGADLLVIPALIGLGLRKLSMNISSTAAVKQKIASLTIKECEKIAEQVLELSTAGEIRDYLSQENKAT